jgi:polysaccharide pyruvyl transferase WcaK-like protein
VTNAPEKSKPNVVIVDYISEKNRGDAAIHLGLINLIRRSHPNAILSAVSIIGTNQFPYMAGLFDQTQNQGIKIFGGMVPTFYPEKTKQQQPAIIFEIKNLIGLFFQLWLLAALKLKIPMRLLFRCIPARYRETFEILNHADLIVIRGRNYRDRKTATLEVVRILTKTYHLLLCSLLSKKIVLVGASVWDQKSNLAGRMLGNAFKACKMVTVREKWSLVATKRMSKTFNFPEPILIPDLSFAAFEERDTIIQNRKRVPRSSSPEVIGITIHDWKTQGVKTRNRYIKSVSGLIQYYSDLGVKVKIIPQVSVYWEDSAKMLEELMMSVETQNIEVIKGDPSVYELLQLYSSLDLLVATRMHSAIFAAAVNTPIVAIPYDKGGKWGIVEELGYRDYLINYDEVTPEILIDKAVLCWENKRELVIRASDIVKKNTESVQAFIKIIQDSLV